MISSHNFFVLGLSALLVACGGGVDVAPVEDIPRTGTVRIELANPALGTLTRMTIDFSGVARELSGLSDDAGQPPAAPVKAVDLGRVCYMSRRAGWNEAATACTDIFPGRRPTTEACYDENNQRTSCPTAYLGDSPLIVIFRNLRNNDAGALRVQVTATGRWYTLGVSDWPCTGTAICTENAEFLREYGNYRPVTGSITCNGGVPTARIHFGTDALIGFGPTVKPGEAGPARWSSDIVGWADASRVSGTIGRDARGDYFFEVAGLPMKDADGTFALLDARKGEWSWMDPTQFSWNANVTVNASTFHIAYDVGSCTS